MGRSINADYEGYAALAVSILAECPPEIAFERLGGKFRGRNRKWTAEKVKEIERLRKAGLRWKEVGEYFGVSAKLVHRVYKYHGELRK